MLPKKMGLSQKGSLFFCGESKMGVGFPQKSCINKLDVSQYSKGF
jgi:hypothetical protein